MSASAEHPSHDPAEIPERIIRAAEDNSGVRWLLQRSALPTRRVIYRTVEFLEQSLDEKGLAIPPIKMEALEDLIHAGKKHPLHLQHWTRSFKNNAANRSFINSVNPEFQDIAVTLMEAVREQLLLQQAATNRES